MIASSKLILSSDINLIIGNNASGKSSIIEAFSILSTGRSFRTRYISEVIRWKTKQLLITASVLNGERSSHIGIEKKQGRTRIRIDQEDIHSQAELSRYIPVTTITPDSIKLIIGSPSERRRYLDWIGFYLLPEYYQIWKQQQRVLKQRNACLRHHKITADFNFWTEELIKVQRQLYEKRQLIFSQLEKSIEPLRKLLLPDCNLSLALTSGFSSSHTFKTGNNIAFYQSKLEQELKLKRTLYGVHKSDLTIYINDSPARVVASRGQLKLLTILLYLAQNNVLTKGALTSGVITLDDIASELDDENQHCLYVALKSLQQQVILTAPVLTAVWKKKNIKMFHVEHGKFIEKDVSRKT
jgi:DNA replication and repair protein RecF